MAPFSRSDVHPHVILSSSAQGMPTLDLISSLGQAIGAAIESATAVQPSA